MEAKKSIPIVMKSLKTTSQNGTQRTRVKQTRKCRFSPVVAGQPFHAPLLCGPS